MPVDQFTALYEALLTDPKPDGWEETLFDAWFGACHLNEDQKSLLEALLV